MNFIKSNLKFIVIFLVLAILMVVGTFFDLQITAGVALIPEGVYYSQNFFAVFFEIFGEMPVYILPSLALGVIFQYITKVSDYKKSTKTLLIILIVIGLIGLNYYGSHKLLKYFNIHINRIMVSGTIKFILEVGLGVCFAAIWFMLSSLVKPKYLKSLAICSLIVVFTAILSQGLTQVIKPLFGRARYRLMNVTGDFSEFTRWYQLGIGKSVSPTQIAMGIEKDGYKSFPSGHTTAAAIVLTLMSLPYLFNFDKMRSRLISFVTILFTVIVAFSRLVMGAHYLTDVTFATIITLTCYLISQTVVFKVCKVNTKTL